MNKLIYLILASLLILNSCALTNKYQKDFSEKEFKKINSQLAIILDEANLKNEKTVTGKKYNVELLGVSIPDAARVIYGNILNIPFVLDHSIYNYVFKLDIVIKQKITYEDLKNITNKAFIDAGCIVTEENGTIYIRKDSEAKTGTAKLSKSIIIHQLQNITSDKAISRLRELLHNEIEIRTISNNETDLIFYSVNNKDKKKVAAILNKIDKPEKQIFLELIIIENNREGILSYGLAGYLQKAVSSLDIKLNLFGTLGTGYQLSLINDTNLFNLIISFLETERYLYKVANPHFIIKSGYDASLSIGDQIPVLASTTIVEGVTSQNITYQSTGINITAKPEIIGNKINIDLNIDLSSGEINKLSSINSPSISRRTIRTKIICNNSQGILIGGIYQSKSYNQNRGFPIQNDIIKNIINQNDKEKSNIELLFYIRPVILNNENIKELEKL